MVIPYSYCGIIMSVQERVLRGSAAPVSKLAAAPATGVDSSLCSLEASHPCYSVFLAAASLRRTERSSLGLVSLRGEQRAV
jgi:hypothetical protein